MELVVGIPLHIQLNENYTTLPEMHLIAYKVMRAILNLSKTNVVHNDIKQDNIIINPANNFETTLINFGWARPARYGPFAGIT